MAETHTHTHTHTHARTHTQNIIKINKKIGKTKTAETRRRNTAEALTKKMWNEKL